MTSAAQDREIEQLKTLLFRTEAGRLAALEADVSALTEYVGGADRLEVATADVLVAALARAEVDRPRELANAIAPSVVSAIRSEIRNSRELMIDALYPITGRLVSAAVGNAFKELLAFIEERLSALTSTELWIARAKSLATGRPVSELLLANSTPLRVNRLLMVERGSGRLIADWTPEGAVDERADLLSGMVAAILEFSVQALAEEASLQRLDFGGKELVLRASPRFILAAECRGALRPADDARINALFFDTIEAMNRGAACDAAILAPLATKIERVQQPREKKGGGRVAMIALGLLLAAGLLWLAGSFANRTILERRVQAVLEEQVARQPLLATFPMRLDFDHGDRILTVSGIAPGDLDRRHVLDALGGAAVDYRVVDRIGIVAGSKQLAALQNEAGEARQALSELERRMEEIGSRLDGDVAGVRSGLAAELEGVRLSLAKELGGVRTGLQGDVASARSELAAELDSVRSGLSADLETVLASSAEEATEREHRIVELARRHADLLERYSALGSRYEELSLRLDQLASAVDTPAERLDRFMASTAIFFGEGDVFLEPEQAARQVAELAELLKGNDQRVRAVGHADEIGSPSVNRELARRRADRVVEALVAAGVDPSRLFVVSRSASVPIADGAGGAGETNRRVTFEHVFRDEPGQ